MRYRRNLAKGIAAGLAGGLVATIAMTQFQNIWSKAADLGSSNGHSREQSNQEEDPTGKTAGAISKLVGKNLSKEQKQKAGPFVHYAFGTLMGGVYGAAVELSPTVKTVGGLPFGTALFVGADEIALPALKLAKGPTSYPASRHAYGFSSHLVWAATAELVRRVIRNVM